MIVNFFTIVHNGMPFIKYHLDVFNKLKIEWHWHIVEGYADLLHDTSWGVKDGARIIPGMHRNFISVDGTSEYLDSIASKKVTIYRNQEKRLWDGKLEMVNAPLDSIKQPCLLWEIDVDELWTSYQIADVHDLFQENPSRTAAFYKCRYLVGPDLWISNRGCYANHDNEWLRTWRFNPGDQWVSHEPPILNRPKVGNIASVSPFLDSETCVHDLTFQHFAYATASQAKFKEYYYGYEDALGCWRNLQSQRKFPAILSDFFPWVKDNAIVEKINFDPLIKC